MSSEPKVSSLVNLVNYQEGSVVSKTLIKKETGTVTLFAFDQGQGLSEHTAPFDALVCVLDGEVEIMISGNPCLLYFDVAKLHDLFASSLVIVSLISCFLNIPIKSLNLS